MKKAYIFGLDTSLSSKVKTSRVLKDQVFVQLTNSRIVMFNQVADDIYATSDYSNWLLLYEENQIDNYLLHQLYYDNCPYYESNRYVVMNFPNDGRYFNPSVIEHCGKKLMLYRKELLPYNEMTELHICELDKNNKIISFKDKMLKLPVGIQRHEYAPKGEDGRLFELRGELCCAYNDRATQWWCVLDADYNVVKAEQHPFTGRIEKNWQFFSHNNELYAIYSLAPYKVLKMDMNNTTGYIKYDIIHYFDITPNRFFLQNIGEPRGGSTPLRVGDEYWCFIHSDINVVNKRCYYMHFYTFEANPPFKLKRISREPLVGGDFMDKPLTHEKEYSVIFPSGALFDGDVFQVFCGWHDKNCRIYTFKYDDLINNSYMVR